MPLEREYSRPIYNSYHKVRVNPQASNMHAVKNRN